MNAQSKDIKAQSDNLIQIAYRNKTSEAVFNLLAVRERNRGLTDLRRLKNQLIEEGFKIIPDEFIQTFRDLAKVGVGDLSEKAGQPAQFRWHYGLKDVGKTAIEGHKAAPAPQPIPIKAAIRTSSTSRLAVVLGKGRVATIATPTDLTADEISLLIDLLKKNSGL